MRHDSLVRCSRRKAAAETLSTFRPRPPIEALGVALSPLCSKWHHHDVRLVALLLAIGGAPSSADEAESILLAARSFDDVAVGYAGETPATVLAYRKLFRARDGVDRFRKVVEQGTPAGKLYGLCGLFFLDPGAFNQQLAQLERSRAPVVRRDGCIASKTTVHDVLTRDERAPLMPRTIAFAQWPEARPEWLDLAGGSTCYRLRYEPVSPRTELVAPDDYHFPE